MRNFDKLITETIKDIEDRDLDYYSDREYNDEMKTDNTNTIEVPQRLQKELADSPETGMGYQSVEVTLKDGQEFKDVMVENGSIITKVDDKNNIPFSSEDIADISLNCHNPNCANQGWYPVQISEDDWEQEQCEFCYTVKNSVFYKNNFIDKI